MQVKLLDVQNSLSETVANGETPPTAQTSSSGNPPVHTHPEAELHTHFRSSSYSNQLLHHQKLANFLFDEFAENLRLSFISPTIILYNSWGGNLLKCVEDNLTDILPLVPSLCTRWSTLTAFKCVRALHTHVYPLMAEIFSCPGRLVGLRG